MSKRRQYGSGSLYRRSSDGRWIGALVVDEQTGRRITVSAKTEAEAKSRLEAKKREVNRHGAPPPGSSPQKTIEAWAASWLAIQEQSLRPRSYATSSSSVARWIVPTIGKRKLAKVTPADVRAVSAAQVDAGRSSSTALRTHTVLMKMLKDAVVEGHQVPDRVFHVGAPSKAEGDRTDIFLPDAIALLEAAVSQPGGSRWVAALLQGMRQGECLGLRWSMVDLERGLMEVSWQLQAIPYRDRANKHLGFRVPQGYEHRQLVGQMHLVRPKTSKGKRVIPIVPWMQAELERWQKLAPVSQYDLVWPNAMGAPQTAAADTEAWKRLQDVAQVARVEDESGRRYLLHEARHTTATLLLEAGVDPGVIQRILGHSNILTTRGYQHVHHEQARRALDTIADKLGLAERSDTAQLRGPEIQQTRARI